MTICVRIALTLTGGGHTMRPEASDPNRGSGVIVMGTELLDRAREVSQRIVERVQKVTEETATDLSDSATTPTEEVAKPE